MRYVVAGWNGCRWPNDFCDLREVGNMSLVKFAPDLTRKVLFSSTFDKMDAKKVEAVRIGNVHVTLVANLFFSCLGSNFWYTTPDDNPLPIQLAEKKNEPINSLRGGTAKYTEFALAVRAFYYPFRISNPRQAERHREPLFLPLTHENQESRSAVSVAQILRLVLQTQFSAANGRFIAMDLTIESLERLSAKTNCARHPSDCLWCKSSCGNSIFPWCLLFLPGKVRSDSIEVRVSAQKKEKNYFVIFSANYGRSAGSIKITAVKVGQQLLQLQSYQDITESANVSSFQKTKRKTVKISNTPTTKRARADKPLSYAAMKYKEELAYLQFYG